MYKLRSYDDLKKGKVGRSINSDTYELFSIPVPGDGMTNYSTLIAEASLWFSTNFSSQQEPINPVVGQLWWDSAEKELKVFDTNWSVVRSNTFDASSLAGDLIPKENGLNIGSNERRFDEIHVKNAYVTTAAFENNSGYPKNITISKDGTISISTTSEGYTDSSGISPTLPQSLNIISNTLGPNVSNSWGLVDLGVGDSVTAQGNKIYYINHDPINSTTPLRIVPSSYDIDFQIIVFTNTFFGGIVIDDSSVSSTVKPIAESKPGVFFWWDVATDSIYVQNTSPVIAKINYIHKNLDLPTISACKRYINITVLSTGTKGEWDVIMTGVEV